MKKFKVQLVWWTNPQEKQLEIEVEATDAVSAVQVAQEQNPGFFAVSAEVIE